MSQEDNHSNEPTAEEGATAEQPPMNRAERRALAAGKKGSGAGKGAMRGPSVMGSQRGGVVPNIANQTRGSNRGK